VLVYWHIEKGRMAIHSQLITCTASEVAAAIEGMMRHGTAMKAEGNDVLFFGKSGELASNRRDQQHLAVAALHLVQACLIFVNTLMIQDMLAEPEWADVLTAEDRRGLNPLFTSHMTPYGEVKLNMSSRLQLSDPAATPA
jgi:TnpA family transposase